MFKDYYDIAFEAMKSIGAICVCEYHFTNLRTFMDESEVYRQATSYIKAKWRTPIDWKTMHKQFRIVLDDAACDCTLCETMMSD